MEQNGWKRDVKRLVLVVAASCVMAMNIKSFVRAGTVPRRIYGPDSADPASGG
ncbi:MAG: hypothetical protein ACLUFA_02955 [[Clostridium] leptum]